VLAGVDQFVLDGGIPRRGMAHYGRFDELRPGADDG
jgi:hypothetical protein